MNHIINIASALVMILSSNLTAQSNLPLDDYIREGLKNNLVLQQKKISLEKALSNESRTKSINAGKYFNFLLNRDLNSQVTADTAEDIMNVFRADNPALEAREEIKMVIQGIEISKSLLHMNQYYWIPKVSSFIDLGAQDSKWNYNRDSRYYLFGFQVEIPIFEGFRNRNKIEMAYRDLHIAEFELQNINRALHLSISVATDELLNAITNYQSSLKQAAVAQNYNRLITKGYQEGVNSFIETVDARNQLTSAQLLVNINKYRVLIAQANYERETASIHIN